MLTRQIIAELRHHAATSENPEYAALMLKNAQEIEDFMGGPEIESGEYSED